MSCVMRKGRVVLLLGRSEIWVVVRAGRRRVMSRRGRERASRPCRCRCLWHREWWRRRRSLNWSRISYGVECEGLVLRVRAGRSCVVCLRLRMIRGSRHRLRRSEWLVWNGCIERTRECVCLLVRLEMAGYATVVMAGRWEPVEVDQALGSSRSLGGYGRRHPPR